MSKAEIAIAKYEHKKAIAKLEASSFPPNEFKISNISGRLARAAARPIKYIKFIRDLEVIIV